MAKKKKKNKVVKRDGNILAAFRREVDLRERKIPDKTKYNRKKKHKNNEGH